MPNFEDLLRSPYESENRYFKSNPHVGGYADFKTGTIVMNPYSPLPENKKKAVMMNEYSRLIMRKNNLLPPFELTPEQREAFKNYGDERSQKETIIGRIISGDLTASGVKPDWIREDGTIKGKGFLGELQTHDGKVSTELSIGVNFDGKERLIPSLVPTLSKDEIDHLLQGGKPTKSIIDKAVQHARKRIAEGKSPFAEDGKAPEIPKEQKEFAEYVKSLFDK